MFGIPKKVFDLVLALAENYGHLWARYYESSAPEDLGAFREYVRRRANEDGDTGPGGILAPNVLYDEGEGEGENFLYVHHTTATKRLEWTIWADDRGNPGILAIIHRPGIEDGVLAVYPNSRGFGLRYQSGGFGQRHLRALKRFLGVAVLHIPELEPILGQLAGLEAEARKHDALEAQHILWSTPLEELQWSAPALQDALGRLFASEAAREFAVLQRAVDAARARWAEFAARNLEQVEA